MAAERDAKPHSTTPLAGPTGDNGTAWTDAQDQTETIGTTADSVAVALLHDPESGALPKVVASGRGFVADQILTLAFSHGVRVRRDADLAQILGQIELGSDIPTEAFAAVAEVLAYVYKANGNTASWQEVVAP